MRQIDNASGDSAELRLRLQPSTLNDQPYTRVEKSPAPLRFR